MLLMVKSDERGKNILKVHWHLGNAYFVKAITIIPAVV